MIQQRVSLSPGEIVETGSGLAGKYLSYQKDGQEVEITPNEDGTYLIPEGVDLKTVRFYIWDQVNNTNTLTLDGKTVSEEVRLKKPEQRMQIQHMKLVKLQWDARGTNCQ